MSIAETIRSVPPSPRAMVWPVLSNGKLGFPAGANQDMQLLDRNGTRLHFDRDETIFNEGDSAEFGYQVVSGVVRLCKHMADGRRQITQFLLPGDFFSFMEPSEYDFSAEAVNESVLICYPRRQIERLGEDRPTMRKHFTTLLLKRVQEIQNHLVMLGRQTAKEKVASFLLLLIERKGPEDDPLLDLPMSRQDIADYLGLTIETVCRVLSAMRRNCLIGIPNLHQLVVIDVEALYTIAEGDDE